MPAPGGERARCCCEAERESAALLRRVASALYALCVEPGGAGGRGALLQVARLNLGLARLVGELDGRKVFLGSVVDLLNGGGDELLAGRTHTKAGLRRAEGARVLARQRSAGAVAWRVSLVKGRRVGRVTHTAMEEASATRASATRERGACMLKSDGVAVGLLCEGVQGGVCAERRDLWESERKRERREVRKRLRWRAESNEAGRLAGPYEGLV